MSRRNKAVDIDYEAIERRYRAEAERINGLSLDDLIEHFNQVARPNAPDKPLNEDVRGFFDHGKVATKAEREEIYQRQTEWCKQKISQCIDEVTQVLLFPALVLPLFETALKDLKHVRKKGEHDPDANRELLSLWRDVKRQEPKATKQEFARYLDEQHKGRYGNGPGAIVRQLDALLRKQAPT